MTRQAQDVLGPTTILHKHFFVENCKLSTFGRYFHRAIPHSVHILLIRFEGAKFLRLFKSSGIHSSLSTVYELAEAISSWRSSLPEDLLIDRVTRWSSANVWIIVLLALSYRLECLLYRWVREQTRGLDEDAFAWSKQQLLSSIFELDTLMKRAIVHGLIKLCPPSL